jgi:anti-anti-sigma regulatory factor
MASNFQILPYKTRDSLHLKLAGDFDGSSAHELIKALVDNDKGYYQVFIDTNDLKTIHPFGREVLEKKLGSISKQFKNPIFIGENLHVLSMN